MADGTRFRLLDERLGKQEERYTDLSEEIGKHRVENAAKLGDVNKRIDELGRQLEGNFSEFRQLLLGLKPSTEDNQSRGNLQNGITQVEVSDLNMSHRNEVTNPLAPHTHVSTLNPVSHLHLHNLPSPPNSLHHHKPNFSPVYTTTTSPTASIYNPNNFSQPTPQVMSHNLSTSNFVYPSSTLPVQNSHALLIPPYNPYLYQGYVPHLNFTTQLPYQTFPAQTIPPSPHSHSSSAFAVFNPSPKIEFPKFNGHDPK